MGGVRDWGGQSRSDFPWVTQLVSGSQGLKHYNPTRTVLGSKCTNKQHSK